MTEDEAKTKWCPFARVAAPTCVQKKRSREWIGVTAANRGDLSDAVEANVSGSAMLPASALCIASACMAWRWDWESQTIEIGGTLELPQSIVSTTHGHCGLAHQ